MDALFLGSPGAAEPQTPHHIKGGAFLKHKLRRQIYGVLREHYEWHLIKEK